MPSSLEQLYSDVSSSTRWIWDNQPDCGEPKEPEYHPDKLALVTGMKPIMPDDVRELVKQLDQLVGEDPLADIMEEGNFHFTFLPITDAIYSNSQPVDGIESVIDSLGSNHDKHICIHSLRLIALPDQLLLAGIPSADSEDYRKQFTQSVLKTSWRESIEERNAGIPLPPPFWHCTLLRYGKDRLPTVVRDFFNENQDILRGELTGTIHAVLANYNWSEVHTIP